VRKLASTAALITAALYLEHWTSFLPDLVEFMKALPVQLRNGMVVLQRFPEEMKKTNRIKHGNKLKIR
jgi:hypothetical protein